MQRGSALKKEYKGNERSKRSFCSFCLGYVLSTSLAAQRHSSKKPLLRIDYETTLAESFTFRLIPSLLTPLPYGE